LAAFDDAAATSEWTVGGRALGRERRARTAIANARRGSGGDEELDALPDHAAARCDAVLRWHADRLPAGRMQESDLLFGTPDSIVKIANASDRRFLTTIDG
jgi:hypothetical protein